MENDPYKQPPIYQPPAKLPQVPKALAVLINGIISVSLFFAYGLPSLICGIIALAMAAKGQRAYNENPGAYSEASYKWLRAGRICAVIGVILSAIATIVWIIFLYVIIEEANRPRHYYY